MEQSVKKEKSSFSMWLKGHKEEVAAYCGLAFCIILFSIVTPFFGQSIWDSTKLSTLITDVIVLGLMSVGSVFIYALGNMDISIGKQIGLYATLMVIIGNATGSLILGIIVCLAIAIVIGAANGAIGDLLHIHPVVSSVVFMMAIGGINTAIYLPTGSRNITYLGFNKAPFKNPWIMIAALVVEILIVSYIFYFTKVGKYARMIGANQKAAQQAGVHIIKYKVIAYIVTGVFLVVAALFMMGYTGSSSDSTGTGYEMNVIVALVLGGMPISGGMRSKVSCAVVGSFTLALLQVGLPMLGVSNAMVLFIKALIFLVVVVITCRKKGLILPR